MGTKRLFISLPLDQTTSKDIHKKFSNLKLPWEKIRTVRPEQLHLTLKFLGDTDIDNIPFLINSLNKVKIGTDDIQLNIYQTQIFSPERPKILNLGIKIEHNLRKLYDQIENMLFDEGLAPKESRQFSAHITLARVKKTASLEEFENFNSWSINKFFYVSHFELQESTLSKNGPEYTVLQTFNL